MSPHEMKGVALGIGVDGGLGTMDACCVSFKGEGLGLMEMIGPLALREPYAISHQAKTMNSSNREGFEGSLLSDMIVSVKDDLKPTVEKRFLVKVVLLTPMDVILVKKASYFPSKLPYSILY